MKSIYNSIKDRVKLHPKISESVLGKVHTWKRSHYVILADVIKSELAISDELQGEKKFELGNSISHITLQRFFESDYQEKTHNDLRFLKTLDKICIFLGYKDLNQYISHCKNLKMHKSEDKITSFAKEIIYKYCEAEFECLKKLPAKITEPLLEFVFEDSPYYHRISELMKSLSNARLKLTTKKNRSNFEIFDISIITDTEYNKVLKTQEFWNLVLASEDDKDHHFVNKLNTQFYFLKKINGIWKIWDNYNPNAGEMINENKKATYN